MKAGTLNAIVRKAALFTGSGLLLGALAGAPGCGPSVQSIYEGNVRFEHCHRLDLDPGIAPTHRHACWREWLRLYTYGQVRDRIEHARARVRSLEQGDTSKPSLKLDGTRRPEERSWYLSSPAPTSASQPPPSTAPAWDGGRGGALDGGSPDAAKYTPAPQAPCTLSCRGDWEDCRRGCAADAASKACGVCEPDYKKCMRRCFD
jgi:hypothetical protein